MRGRVRVLEWRREEWWRIGWWTDEDCEVNMLFVGGD